VLRELDELVGGALDDAGHDRLASALRKVVEL
jgi:hypothetical protein